MLPEIDRILISREEIDARVRDMGEKLSSDLSEAVLADGFDPLAHPDRVVMVPILTGAMVFAADLIRAMPMKLSLRLVTVSSYPGQSFPRTSLTGMWCSSTTSSTRARRFGSSAI